MELAGKTAFVSGGGGGIGGGMAEAFVEKGMKVVLADVQLDYAKEEAARLGEQALPLALDVTSLDSWAAAREAAIARFGRVDVLCNNAGVSTTWTSLDQFSPEEFERVMAINVTGVFYGIRTFAGDMRQRGSGHIVNTSSMNGLSPYRGLATYSASKFAVFGLSDAVRDELAQDGVGVSTLFPGLVRSRMSMNRASGAQGSGVSREALEARMMDPLRVGRAVARAIETDAPYIVTHPEHKAHFEARCRALLDAFDAGLEPG
ncbi:SDR family NAD(P)-dependent oxidoreductase [Phenylobacterium sp. LjRoot225]|uniref:SDR family oxidoreductase n=1 Tax=Phenylobacterium sp. LjRoot225 TaxID=3342285 RepID=UPI003ECEE1E7